MITVWSQSQADEFMPEAILTELTALIHRHPWWRARTRLVLRLLKRHGVAPGARVLDAGCGWGVTLAALEQRGYRATGLDVSRQALERLNRPERHLIQADLTHAFAESQVSSSGYDVILALDVVEHIDDDQAAVTNLARLLRPGGIFIVSVPALPELFSEFDRVQGHRRRYCPDDVRGLFSRAGLHVEQLFWWASWLVPVFRSRKRSRETPSRSPAEIYRQHLKLPPRPLDALLSAAFRWDEYRAIRGKNRRGTSLVAIARKAAPAAAAFSRPADQGASRKYAITL